MGAEVCSAVAVATHLNRSYRSNLIEGAWAGCLVHLSGLDVIGPTAGSLSRILQDREIELWEGKRIVTEASPLEVYNLFLSSSVF